MPAPRWVFVTLFFFWIVLSILVMIHCCSWPNGSLGYLQAGIFLLIFWKICDAVPGGVVGGSLEDAVVGCGQKRPSSFLYPTSFDTPPAAAAAAGEEDQAGDVDQDGSDEYYCSGGHNNNNNAVESSKKRRLTFEQVRSLERNFELENKLEPERKMQLAKELGLQPRQVAVWFQNRRARWKTKQLERDYELLSSDYTRLKAEFEATVQEKERLKSEVRSMPSLSMSRLLLRMTGNLEYISYCSDVKSYILI